MDINENYKSIIDHMNEALYLCSPEKNIIYINPAAERLTGWSFQEALTKKCYEIFGNKDQQCSKTYQRQWPGPAPGPP